jgi:hypothetical protein
MRSVAAGGGLADLVGASVTRFVIDDALALHCRRADGLSGVIRCDGEVVTSGALGTHRFAMDRDPAGCAPALRLLYARITSLAIEPDGSLVAAFGESALRVQADPHQVGWSVSVANGFSAHCLAEGRVIVDRRPASPPPSRRGSARCSTRPRGSSTSAAIARPRSPTSARRSR